MAEQSRTVWAVASGSYSEYRVHALFERQEDAEAAVALGLGDTALDQGRVEEFPLFPAGALPSKRVLWVASAVGWVNPADPAPAIAASSTVKWAGVDPLPSRPRVEAVRDSAPKGAARWRVWAEATSREAAIKACSDAVAKLRAEALEPAD